MVVCPVITGVFRSYGSKDTVKMQDRALVFPPDLSYIVTVHAALMAGTCLSRILFCYVPDFIPLFTPSPPFSARLPFLTQHTVFHPIPHFPVHPDFFLHIRFLYQSALFHHLFGTFIFWVTAGSQPEYPILLKCETQHLRKRL